MPRGFSNLPFQGESVDGENWTATKPILFTTLDGLVYRVPVGSTSDGPSVPHWAESALGRTGPQWLCGVLHDAAYRGALELQDGQGNWRPANLDKAECDSLFLEALQSQGVAPGEALLFYEAVRRCGGAAFREDRAAAAAAAVATVSAG